MSLAAAIRDREVAEIFAPLRALVYALRAGRSLLDLLRGGRVRLGHQDVRDVVLLCGLGPSPRGAKKRFREALP